MRKLSIAKKWFGRKFLLEGGGVIFNWGLELFQKKGDLTRMRWRKNRPEL